MADDAPVDPASLEPLDVAAALDTAIAEAEGKAPATGKLYRARSRLYRSQILQLNMRLKALAEIYTMHSFAEL